MWVGHFNQGAQKVLKYYWWSGLGYSFSHKCGIRILLFFTSVLGDWLNSNLQVIWVLWWESWRILNICKCWVDFCYVPDFAGETGHHSDNFFLFYHYFFYHIFSDLSLQNGGEKKKREKIHSILYLSPFRVHGEKKTYSKIFVWALRGLREEGHITWHGDAIAVSYCNVL